MTEPNHMKIGFAFELDAGGWPPVAREVQPTRDIVREKGCESERSNLPRLIAINIPAAIPIRPIAQMLNAGESAGKWEIEEGALRHADSGFSYLEI